MGFVLKIKEKKAIKEVDALEYLLQVLNDLEVDKEEMATLEREIKEIADNVDGVDWIQKTLNERGVITIGDIHMAHIWGPGEGAVIGI